MRVSSDRAGIAGELIIGDATVLADGVTVSSAEPGQMQVTGMTSDDIGYRAAAAGLTVLELSPIQASLEEAFMALTHDAVEYRAPTTDVPERIAA